ncbi:MAG: glucodextranase DOMON-like domain-containing protein, partial [Promethearchaeota archaeon]
NIPGSGRTDCDQNGHFNIESDHAWEYMVRADGWLQYILLEDDTQITGVDTFSDSVDKIIVFSAPASVIGIPQDDWAYTVVVGSQDFQHFREFFEVPQEWNFGGGDDSSYDPNVVDILLPEYMNQTEILESFDVDSEIYCTIPAVYNGMESTRQPEIDILNSDTNYTLTENEVNATITINFSVPNDVDVDYFEIYVNSTLLTTLTAESINVSLALGVGIHNITIKVVDVTGESASDSIIIIIKPYQEPSNNGFKIPGYNYLGIIGVIVLVTNLIVVKRKKN